MSKPQLLQDYLRAFAPAIAQRVLPVMASGAYDLVRQYMSLKGQAKQNYQKQQAQTGPVQNRILRTGETQRRPRQRRNRRRRNSGGMVVASNNPGRIRVTQSVAAPVSFGKRISGAGGIADTRFRFSYMAGTLWVGNGTLGSNNYIYMLPYGQSTKVCDDTIPIAPADSTYGTVYMADVMKHFTRKVFHRIIVRTVPLASGNATTTGGSTVLVPVQGGNESYTISAGGTPPIYSIQVALGCSGSVSHPVWEEMVLDLTPYIRGGSGARQNEFYVGASGVLSGAVNAADQVPCSFVVAGQATPNTLGTIGLVYIELDMSLHDFRATAQAYPTITPSATIAKFRSEKTDRKMDTADLVDIPLPPPSEAERMSVQISAPQVRQTYAAAAAPRGAYLVTGVGAGGPPPRSPTPRPDDGAARRSDQPY